MKCFTCITVTLRGRICALSPHFMDEETKAERGEMTCFTAGVGARVWAQASQFKSPLSEPVHHLPYWAKWGGVGGKREITILSCMCNKYTPWMHLRSEPAATGVLAGCPASGLPWYCPGFRSQLLYPRTFLRPNRRDGCSLSS